MFMKLRPGLLSVISTFDLGHVYIDVREVKGDYEINCV